MEFAHGYSISIEGEEGEIPQQLSILCDDPPVVYTPHNQIDKDGESPRPVENDSSEIVGRVIPHIIRRNERKYDGDGVPLRIVLNELVERYGLSEDDAYAYFIRTGYGFTPYEMLMSGRVILADR